MLETNQLLRHQLDICNLLLSLDSPEKTRIKRCTLHQYAKEHRTNPTKAEKLFKATLYSIGEQPIRCQVKLQFMIIDFVLPYRNLLIEVDGSFHDNAWKAKQDIIRDAYLNGLGFNTMRIRNDRVKDKQLIKDMLKLYPHSQDSHDKHQFLMLRADARTLYQLSDKQQEDARRSLLSFYFPPVDNE